MGMRPKATSVVHVTFSLLTAVLAAFTYQLYDKYTFYSSLARGGVDAVGTVVEKVPPDTVVLRYDDAAGGSFHIGHAGITPELYDRLEPGDTLRIRYLDDEPERPEVVPYIEPTRRLVGTTLALAVGLLVFGALIPWVALGKLLGRDGR